MSENQGISRRTFLKLTGAVGAGVSLKDLFRFEPWYLESRPGEGDEPLDLIPAQDWEKVYRDVYSTDGSFVFLCAPNDTHNCLLRAYTKNDVIVRIEPTYGFGEATDVDGNPASHRWDPRCCQKGLSLVRRFYGDRRVKFPVVRRGFKEWVDAGFPRDPDTGEPKMDRRKRGEDAWVKLSWDEALEMVAKTFVNIATTYSGAKGAEYLKKQGYDPDMLTTLEGAGVRTLKFRGGMPLLGVTRIFGAYRFANMLALLDAAIRTVEADKAKGARGWDNYSWHTDLPPGHPMVTGQQTVDFDLFAVENANLVVIWGMNWILTKMPDGHWISESRLKGTRFITISGLDYQATAKMVDEVILIRPGTDGALALGCCQYIIQNKLYDEEIVKQWTDLPLLVRMDTRTLLRAADIIPGYKPAALTNYVKVLKAGETTPPPFKQTTQFIPEALRSEWGDFVIWDTKTKTPKPLPRDYVGEKFKEAGVAPALEGEFEVTLTDGKKVKVRPVFSLIKQFLDDSFDLQTTSEITWAPKEAIASLAKQIAANKGKTLITHGMGPNQMFNGDLFGRAVFLLGALTDNVGHIGGNVGSFAGNYRAALFNGLPQFVMENPFDQELDPTKPARLKPYLKFESAHYSNYGDRPLRVGNKNFTGKTHMPSPTKVVYLINANSNLGNTKWHHDYVANSLPRIEAIFVNEWWWTATCEYADLVLPVDSWAEFKFPDMCASVTNPFLYIYPPTPLKRMFDTKSDIEVLAGVAQKLTSLTGDKRFADHWRFVTEGKVEVYLQRIINASTSARGYKSEELIAKAKEGIPMLMNMRTYPDAKGWEQRNESKPWYTRSGRLEFYRDEPEWLEHGENLPVYREPVDSTYYEPNVIVAKPHPVIQPKGPKEYGLDPNDQSSEVRQVRNVVKPWSEVKQTKHPLTVKDPGYRFPFITPKYRTSAHTTTGDTDWLAFLFGPFGDPFRHDKRMPAVGEGYLEINPEDAKALDIKDGDYVWFDADPSDRPYRGWKEADPYYKVARGMARARVNNAILPGTTRMWFNMYVATTGSVKGQGTRPDGLAKNPDTNYQALFRHGSHQSGTRAWLRPTLMTDTLVRKPIFGHEIGKGFEPDIHTVVGAPRESFIKIEKAEDGGFGGKGPWRPLAEGFRPGAESEAMKKYLEGKYFAS